MNVAISSETNVHFEIILDDMILFLTRKGDGWYVQQESGIVWVAQNRVHWVEALNRVLNQFAPEF
jgi:hypothetical protein